MKNNSNINELKMGFHVSVIVSCKNEETKAFKKCFELHFWPGYTWIKYFTSQVKSKRDEKDYSVVECIIREFKILND